MNLRSRVEQAERKTNVGMGECPGCHGVGGVVHINHDGEHLKGEPCPECGRVGIKVRFVGSPGKPPPEPRHQARRQPQTHPVLERERPREQEDGIGTISTW